MTNRFAETAHDEWIALLPELHGLALEEAPPVPPSEAELMDAIVEHLRAWGGWRSGSSIVGCRLRDRAGLVIAEIPAGNKGWFLLHALLRDGRIERRRMVRAGASETRWSTLRGETRVEYRVPPGT